MKRFIFVLGLFMLLGFTNTVSLARTNVTDESCFTASDNEATTTVSVIDYVKCETPCPVVSLDLDDNKGLFSGSGLSAKLNTLKNVYLYHGSIKNETHAIPYNGISGSSGVLPYRQKNPLFA